TAAGLGALTDRRQQSVTVQLLALARGADEAVSLPAGEARRHLAGGAHVDRDRTLGPVVDGGSVHVVIVAVELDELLGPELADEPGGLAQAPEALAEF